MQNWYNHLTKGQKIVIWALAFVVPSLIVGVIYSDIALVGGIIGLLGCLFLHLGSKK